MTKIHHFHVSAVFLYLTLLCLSGRPVALASESEFSFKLDDYQQRDIADYSLRLIPSLNANTSGSFVRSSRSFGRSWSVSRSVNESESIFGGLTAHYSRYDYSLKKVYSLDLSVRGSGSLSSSRQSDPDFPGDLRQKTRFNDYDNGGRLINASVRGSYDLYLTKDLFLTTTAIFSGTMSHSSSDRLSLQIEEGGAFFFRETEQSLKRTANGRSILGTVTAGVGLGRTYVGRFGYFAWNILDELRREGVLDGAIDKDLYVRLADLLYELKTIHAVDTRLKRIESVQRISELLVRGGVLAEESARSTAIILDLWDYSPTNTRLFGWKGSASAGLKIEESLSKTNNTENTVTRTIDSAGNALVPESVVTDVYREERFAQFIRPFVELEYGYFKPLSFKTTFRTQIMAQIYANSDEKYVETEYGISASSFQQQGSITRHRNSYDVSLFGTIERIISTRTLYSVSASIAQTNRSWTLLDTNPSVGESPFILHFRELSRRASMSTKIEYRIAIPTTLIANASVTYLDQRVEGYGGPSLHDGFSASVNSSIVTWIF